MTGARVFRVASMDDGDRVRLPVPATAQGTASSPKLEQGSISAAEAAWAEGLAKGLAEAERRISEEIERRDAVREAQAVAHRDRLSAESRARSQRVESILAQLHRVNAQALDEIERQASALAFDAVCRVMAPVQGDTSMQHAQLAAAVVRQAFSAQREARVVALRIHPRELELLLSTAEGRCLQALMPGVRWEPDAGVAPLTVILDSECGQIEAALEQSLQRLRALWTDVLATSSREAIASKEGAR